MKKLLNNKLILVVLVVVVAAGAWYMLAGTEPAAILSNDGVDSTSPAEREILSTLLELRSITLDGSILSDQSFLSLQDYSTEIVSEPIGRPNPFAPLSTPAAPSGQTTQ